MFVEEHVLDMKVNYLMVGDFENVEYLFIVIAPRSTLTWSGGSNRTNYICKQVTDVE